MITQQALHFVWVQHRTPREANSSFTSRNSDGPLNFFFELFTSFIFAYGHAYMCECVSITLAGWSSQDNA